MNTTALLFYVCSLSMTRTARLLGDSTSTIQAWLEQCAAAYSHKPKAEGRAVVIELDEMWIISEKVRAHPGSLRALSGIC